MKYDPTDKSITVNVSAVEANRLSELTHLYCDMVL